MNIYLTGFMGSGKTTVGQGLAQALNRKFIDLDDLLERDFKSSITEYFQKHGETAFRKAETKALRKAAERQRLVVATGGGVVIRPENRELMNRTGQVVHLAASLETCRSRMSAEEVATRPLWQDERALIEAWTNRRPLYEQAGLSLAVDGLTRDRVLTAALEKILPPVRFPSILEGIEAPVVATLDGPAEAAKLVGRRRAVILTDRRVGRFHLDRYRTALGDVETITLPGGERIKTLSTAGRVFQRLLDGHYNRDDILIGLGGGAVTDLGALVAATYKRGMGFLLASTSLLGCVDASVGGKAAINHGPAKNVIGAFTHPDGVILDLAALATLGLDQVREGAVEAYKTGLVASPELAEMVEEEWSGLQQRDVLALARVATLSARTKAAVVADDFRESGRRMILNLGHTYGHAVEGWHDYKVSHGRSVALGTIVAARLSVGRGLLEQAVADRIEETVRKITPIPQGPPADVAWEMMKHDKKIRQGRLAFVLLEGIGRPRVVNDLTEAELKAALAGLEG